MEKTGRWCKVQVSKIGRFGESGNEGEREWQRENTKESEVKRE